MKNETFKEITVYTLGDSKSISTWSNVPYLFTKTLESRGIKVNRVNLKPSYIASLFFERVVMPVFKKWNRDTSYGYFRTKINFLHQKSRIMRSIKKYKSSSMHLFLTYTFFAKKKVDDTLFLQFGDWPYDYYLEHFHRTKADTFENSSAKREMMQIKSSDGIFCLFPGPYKHITARYRKKNVYYLGNVINSCDQPAQLDVIREKQISKQILFIGDHKYKEGADALIEACKDDEVKEENVSVHIVGMNKEEFGEVPEKVICHGYLDKGVAEERERYYSLLKKARIVVNTTPKWAGFSSMAEAMYYYTPIIVNPYEEFKRTFGEKITFGYYCDNRKNSLKKAILKIMHNADYDAFCKNAHEAVKEFGWESYCSKFLQIAQEILKEKRM